METNIWACWLLAMEARELSETSLSLSRVMITRKPVLDSISFLSFWLICRVMFFSCNLDLPNAPRSSPPCPASMQIVSMGLGLLAAGSAGCGAGGWSPEVFRCFPALLCGGSGCFFGFHQVKNHPERLFQDKIFTYGYVALEENGENAVVFFDLVGHPFQQSRILDGD